MIALSEKLEQLNALEPASLSQAFAAHPPEGFTALSVECGIDSANTDFENFRNSEKAISAFFTQFDLLTVLDDNLRWIVDLLAKLRLGDLTRLQTLFSGTTVTEYTVYPSYDDIKIPIDALIREAHSRNAQLLILKDLPVDSPLLSAKGNEISSRIQNFCMRDGRFILVSGQALAYVPIDFDSIDDYLARVSKVRRKDLRKKLRKRDELEVRGVPTGRAFKDNELLEKMYRLYLNVYDQSKYHFDKLSFEFFKSILENGSNGGIVFLYFRENDLIGFNICFVHKGNLVDKYVGFAYPQARNANLYFVSWFHNLEYAMSKNLKNYVAGWTDPEVKAYLGASFTFTQHAVYVRNSLLRGLLTGCKRFFENDKSWQNTRS